jgi:hypothetical protein
MEQSNKGRTGGRPLMLTIDRARKFYRAILEGNTITNASAQIGVHKDTVNRWRAEGSSHNRSCDFELIDCSQQCELAAKRRFYINTEKAIALAEAKLVERLNNHTKSTQNGALTLEVLARRNPSEWGKKSELNVKHSGKVQQVSRVIHSIEPTQRLSLGKYLMEKAQRELEGTVLEEDTDEAEILS